MSSVDKIAVIYARYSSHGQTEQSIEGQIALHKNMRSNMATQSFISMLIGR